MARNITYRIHNLHIWFQLHVAMLFCISPHEAVLCVSNYITASTRHVHMLTVLVRFQTNEIWWPLASQLILTKKKPTLRAYHFPELVHSSAHQSVLLRASVEQSSGNLFMER